jgi:hypothetical protein
MAAPCGYAARVRFLVAWQLEAEHPLLRRQHRFAAPERRSAIRCLAVCQMVLALLKTAAAALVAGLAARAALAE